MYLYCSKNKGYWSFFSNVLRFRLSLLVTTTYTSGETLLTGALLFYFFYHYITICSIYRHDAHHQEVKIALVGKYIKLEDAYISVIKALQHAALACRHRLSLIVRPSHTFSLLSPSCPPLSPSPSRQLLKLASSISSNHRKWNRMILKTIATLKIQSNTTRPGNLSALLSESVLYIVTLE